MLMTFLFCSDGANLTMANIEEEEEEVVVVEVEPPKRKKIATLKVRDHCDGQFTFRSASPG